MIRNRLAVAGLVAGLAGGAVAGAVLGVPAIVGAQDDATTTTAVADETTTTVDEPTTTVAEPDDEVTTTTEAADDTTTTTAKPEDDTDDGDEVEKRGDRTQHLQDALAPLVADGTITQAQADKVIEALKDAMPKRGHGKGHGKGGFGFGFGRGGFDLEAAAEALGIDVDALKTSLKDGQSIKDIAAGQGIDVQQVIDSLVAELKTKLDEQVAAGRITQQEANEKLLRSAAFLTDMVNGELPKFPGRPDAPDAPDGD
jgi:hypothetical protein